MPIGAAAVRTGLGCGVVVTAPISRAEEAAAAILAVRHKISRNVSVRHQCGMLAVALREAVA